MAAAAAGAATAAATTRRAFCRTIPRRTEDGELALHLGTRARGTGGSLPRRGNEFLEAVIAMTTSVFVNGHGLLLVCCAPLPTVSRLHDSGVSLFFAFFPPLG